MTWIPLFEISSRDFDEDITLFKKIFKSFEQKIHYSDGFKFSPEAEFAMGWWFYNIYVKAGFIKKLVEHEHMINPNIIDENGILQLVSTRLKHEKSKARVKFHGDKPFFARYWSWLMK